MQSSPFPDEQPQDAGAGESTEAAANAASSQADATASMEVIEVPEDGPTGAGESTMTDDEAVPSPS